MQDIKPGDNVTHNGYPIGKLKSVRTCIGHGGQQGLVQIHGYAADDLTAIPMNELKRDTRFTEAAL